VAKRIEESKIKEIVDYFVQNNVTYIDVAKKFKVATKTVLKFVKASGVEYDPQRTRRGLPAWNVGLSKATDSRIASYAKTSSNNRSTHRKKDGYSTVYDDTLKKSVKIHDQVWFKKTGVWPNGKQGEQIHHIDCDKDNNDIDNLLLTSVSEHSKIHKEYEEVFVKLLRLGLLKFDKNKRGIDWASFQLLLEKLSQ
jgi:hypothetical protein